MDELSHSVHLLKDAKLEKDQWGGFTAQGKTGIYSWRFSTKEHGENNEPMTEELARKILEATKKTRILTKPSCRANGISHNYSCSNQFYFSEEYEHTAQPENPLPGHIELVTHAFTGGRSPSGFEQTVSDALRN